MGSKSVKRLDKDEEFLQSLARNDLESVRTMLSERPYYINKPITDKLWTALFIACEFEHFDLIHYLITEKQADMEHEDENQLTPLVYCAYKNTRKSREIAVALAMWGANVGHRTESGATAITIAQCNGKSKFASTLRQLLEHGPYAKLPSLQILKQLWIWEHCHYYGVGRLGRELVREICSFY